MPKARLSARNIIVSAHTLGAPTRPPISATTPNPKAKRKFQTPGIGIRFSGTIQVNELSMYMQVARLTGSST